MDFEYQINTEHTYGRTKAYCIYCGHDHFYGFRCVALVLQEIANPNGVQELVEVQCRCRW